MLLLISLLVENKPGALMRVTGVLSARGYNIDSLTVARTLDPGLSRMTIVADVEAVVRPQVIKQIQRLINVVQVVDLTDAQVVCRELMLAKVQVSDEQKATFLKEVEIFRARVVDAAPGAYTVEITGDSEKLDAFIEVLQTYGEIEVIRSGAMALPRSTRENKKKILSRERQGAVTSRRS